MFKKSLSVLTAAVIMLAGLASVASAHATVSPKTVAANSYEVFTLRVPVEKESDTVKVRVEIPEGFAVSRVRPLPGWTYTIEKTADGKALKAITWTGGKIAPGEYEDFSFQGKTAANAGKFAFKAYQTYADGETVEWAGPSDAAKPASVVEVTAAPTTTDAHGAPTTTTAPAPAASPAPVAPAAPATAAQAPATSPITTAAAYGGLLLGGAALVLSLRRK